MTVWNNVKLYFYDIPEKSVTWCKHFYSDQIFKN